MVCTIIDLVVFKVEVELLQEQVKFLGDPSYGSGFAIFPFEDGAAGTA